MKNPAIRPLLEGISARTGVPWDRLTVSRWRPDTCGCSFLRWHDDDDGVVHYETVEDRCDEHTTVDDEECYEAARGEMGLKNRAQQAVREALGLTHEDELPSSWGFAADRRLIVTVNGINEPTRREIAERVPEAEIRRA